MTKHTTATAATRHSRGRQEGQPQQPPPWQPWQMYGQPMGQRVIKHEDQKSEVETPWQQTAQAIRCRQMRYGVTSLIVLILAFALYIVMGEYAVFPIAGGAVIVAAIVAYGWFDEQGVDMWRVIAPAIGVGLVGAAGLGVYIVYNDVVIPWQAWVLLVACWVAGFFVYVYFVPLDAAEWRYIAEVYDPNGPTATKMPETRGGVRYPWTPEDDEKVSTDELSEIREQLERVTRILTARPYDKVIQPIPGNWSNGGNGGGNGAQPTQQPRPEAPPYGRVAICAPTSGRKVAMEALVQFLRQSGRHGTGAREWKSLDGWSEELWADVCDVWAMLGAFEAGRPGVSGKFVVDYDDAMYRLLHYAGLENGVERPTPPEPVLTGQFTPGGTGQDRTAGQG